MIAIGAAKIQGRKAVAFIRRETGITDFTEKLAFGTIIPVEIDGGRFTAWTGASLRDIAFLSPCHGFNELSIPLLPVRDQLFVGPVLLIGFDDRKFIHFELLILGRMGIFKSPLLERNISADKVNQPAVLLIKLMA